MPYPGQIVNDPFADVKDVAAPRTEGFSEEKLGASLGKAIADGFKELSATMPKEPRVIQVPVPQPRVEAPKGDPNPLEEAISKVVGAQVGPALAQLGAQVQTANDKADFYSNPKFGWAGEIRDEIEAMFNTLQGQSKPMAREDIAKWIRGNRFEEFAEKRAKDHEAQVRAAAAAGASVGAGSPPHLTGTPNFRDMSEADIDKYMEDKSF